MTDSIFRGVVLLAIVFCFTPYLYSQSAIGQLESITKQKIDTHKNTGTYKPAQTATSSPASVSKSASSASMASSVNQMLISSMMNEIMNPVDNSAAELQLQQAQQAAQIARQQAELARQEAERVRISTIVNSQRSLRDADSRRNTDSLTSALSDGGTPFLFDRDAYSPYQGLKITAPPLPTADPQAVTEKFNSLEPLHNIDMSKLKEMKDAAVEKARDWSSDYVKDKAMDYLPGGVKRIVEMTKQANELREGLSAHNLKVIDGTFSEAHNGVNVLAGRGGSIDSEAYFDKFKKNGDGYISIANKGIKDKMPSSDETVWSFR